MRAVVRDGSAARVAEVDDPKIDAPTDAIVRVSAAGICGADNVPGVGDGDVLGHEAIGIVEETGGEVARFAQGDRVVLPSNVACGACHPCRHGLQSQCATLGGTYGRDGIPGTQAEYVRVAYASVNPVPVPPGPPDHRFLLLADVLPAAWQAVTYADVPPGGTLAIWGLGPIGQMCARIALHRGAERVFGADLAPARIEMARRHGVETIDVAEEEPVAVVRALTAGRGADAVIDAVGMHGKGVLGACLSAVRRGGTLSIVGTYAGAVPAVALGDLFERQVSVRGGRANVRRWLAPILPLVRASDDPLGVDDLVTHTLPLAEGARAHAMFRRCEEGAVKVVLTP